MQNIDKQKFLTELIGTFFLVTVVSFTGNPIFIGAVLALLVYSGGHISGAHFNPAVTLSMLIRKKISAQDSMRYIIAQFLGAIIASGFYFITHHTLFIPMPSAMTPWLIAFIIEVCFTFLLVRTIHMVAVDSRVKNNQYFGLAIGAALMVGAAAGGPISGGAFNPAVGIGPILFDLPHIFNHLSLLNLYLMAPIVGALLAVISVG